MSIPLRPWRSRVTQTGTVAIDDASGEYIFEIEAPGYGQEIAAFILSVVNTPIVREDLTSSGIEALRDKFAGQALAGLMSATDRDGIWTTSTATANAARIAYEAADAMLVARKGGDA